MTLAELTTQFRSCLASFYSGDEAEAVLSLLFQHHFQCNRLELSLRRNDAVGEELLQKISIDLEKLLNHVPIQYIIGEVEFCDLHLLISPAVLIPRPETEELVAIAIKTLKPSPFTILDVCTGSGCIALSLKKQFPQSQVFALEISDDALTLAQNNAVRNQLDIHFIKENALSLSENLYLPDFDLIISNPPYVTETDKKQMERNVLDYEPALALFVSDDDPLIFYREIAKFASQKLKTGGWLMFEINESLGSEMHYLLDKNNFKDTQIHTDFRGKARFCIAHK